MRLRAVGKAGRRAALAFCVWIGGLGAFGWGGVALAQEAPFPTASESPRVRAPIATAVQGKPSANASGAQTTRFANTTQGKQEAAQKPAPQPVQQQAPGVPQTREEAMKNPAAPCVEPPPMVKWQDYNGPMNKIVGTFARKLERKSAHAPHYKPGAVLCSLELKDKFILFVQDTIDPVTILGVGFDAAIDQAENSDPTFGQGAAGYGKRFGANLADQASSTFFKDFAFPALFSEDPRYYRLVHASGRRRFFHAMEHAFVAHRDNGKRMFNFSEWLGTTSGVALGNLYHPDNERGFGPAAQRVGISVLTDAGFDVLREFWPEISRKFKLPFRGGQEPAGAGTDAEKK